LPLLAANRSSKMAGLKHPMTPDGRYFIVRGKLWRMSNPDLDPGRKTALVRHLMDARRAVKAAKSCGDQKVEAEAHRAVDTTKQALGERGPVWWNDGAPDLNRQTVKNTPYAEWYAQERNDSRVNGHRPNQTAYRNFRIRQASWRSNRPAELRLLF
jgi:hypothetical protein